MRRFTRLGVLGSASLLGVGTLLVSSVMAWAVDSADLNATRQQAIHGDAKAQNVLGTMYMNGEGVTKDYQQAVLWFRKAAKGNNADALFNLGTIYEKGLGVHQDYDQASRWYLQARDQGHSKADSRIDRIDDVLATLDCDADAGSAEAQVVLGELYANGNGVPQSDEQAAELYLKSAEQGNTKAQVKLGIAYAEGKGVPQDDEQAVAWYRKAIEQDYAPAKYSLAGMYFKGKGVPKDKVYAYAWLSLAVAQGDGNAIGNKDFAASMLTAAQIAEANTLAGELQAKIDAKK